ncbi:MAG: RNA 2',3'-cyclic phosphodiesterase [Candidatus Paceibacterota bacterium]|jgi:2'-5' RNA ligase
MNKRIFVSISLPESIKNKLVLCQEEISDSFLHFNDFCPVKWTKKHNLHITLFFIGYVELEQLVSVFETVENIVKKHDSFKIDLKNISYGPKEKSPKMVWVSGENSPELGKLQSELEKELLNVRQPDNSFTPHITLGRIVQWKFNKIEPEERPDVFKDISFSFNVGSVEIMESDPNKPGNQYAVLKSIPLK